MSSIAPHPMQTGGIKRSKMPQIDPELLKGIPTIRIDPSVLKSTQSDFSEAKIKEIAKTLDADKSPPIIISSDFYVLDGHHRWLAHGLANKHIEAIQLVLPKDEALEILHKIQGNN